MLEQRWLLAVLLLLLLRRLTDAGRQQRMLRRWEEREAEEGLGTSSTRHISAPHKRASSSALMIMQHELAAMHCRRLRRAPMLQHPCLVWPAPLCLVSLQVCTCDCAG